VKPARVVLIGPECTGKTWLAGELAALYSVPWSREYAREYVERHPGELSYADVEPIARGQVLAEEAALARALADAAPLVVLDTDLISTAVYSRHYYGDCPAWIEQQAARRLGELYLLHHVDVPWVEDGRQREQPERRVELLERFHATLASVGARVVQVRGGWDERRRLAVQAVDGLLQGPVHAVDQRG
jgi:HTH-type transcriptional repressor of NAD biosynthesis genes